MNSTIKDRAAIDFAVAFYDALAAGEDVEFAFELGCSLLVNLNEHQTPVLKKKLINPVIDKTLSKRIFISYKRNVEPDKPVAMQILQALSQQHQVFIDQRMLVGTRWAEHIEAELRQADYFIVLLSSRSVYSEMVEAEIRMAYELAQVQQGRPAILPVRLANEGLQSVVVDLISLGGVKVTAEQWYLGFLTVIEDTLLLNTDVSFVSSVGAQGIAPISWLVINTNNNQQLTP
ncbi:toll/interleukin-1 receptor domain-containing protein [Scytonema sp. NUACC26]|uniref:toll/interleukin-1 receptor domain-containing protein n=1 Tax=Scytonema sp. NUACC26 TaxID=3140176 RepID=UPI0034DBC35D